MIYRVLCSNNEVTKFYLDIIKRAYEKNGYFVEDKDIDGISTTEKDIIICARILDAIKLFRKNKKCKYVYWFQGIEPEESYMVHHSKLRKIVLNYLEKKVLKNVDYLFFVSDSMKKYLEKKHKITIPKNKYHIMPCFNTQIQESAFNFFMKYKSNNFVYVGSLSKWQKFEETVEIFKKIKENVLSDAELYIYTFDVDKAEKILNNKNVAAKEVKKLSPEELPDYLSKIKYGFIIRDDDPINNVATPTKISTYLSCGIIPIYSNYLEGMSNILDNTIYKIPISDNKPIIFPEKVENNKIYLEYKNIFEHDYNSLYHILEFENDMIHATLKDG